MIGRGLPAFLVFGMPLLCVSVAEEKIKMEGRGIGQSDSFIAVFLSGSYGPNRGIRSGEKRKDNEMERQKSLRTIISLSLLTFSFLFSSTVFATNVSHTITIVNNSNTPLKPATGVVVYNVTPNSCAAVPTPADCSNTNLTVPSSIAANSSATVTMSGPDHCNVSAWQAYWTLNIKGSNGTIQCFKSPVNACNKVTPNYTCTISQSNVDAVTGNKNNVPASSVQ